METPRRRRIAVGRDTQEQIEDRPELRRVDLVLPVQGIVVEGPDSPAPTDSPPPPAAARRAPCPPPPPLQIAGHRGRPGANGLRRRHRLVLLFQIGRASCRERVFRAV